jgi:hypothetical protein
VKKGRGGERGAAHTHPQARRGRPATTAWPAAAPTAGLRQQPDASKKTCPAAPASRGGGGRWRRAARACVRATWPEGAATSHAAPHRETDAAAAGAAHGRRIRPKPCTAARAGAGEAEHRRRTPDCACHCMNATVDFKIEISSTFDPSLLMIAAHCSLIAQHPRGGERQAAAWLLLGLCLFIICAERCQCFAVSSFNADGIRPPLTRPGPGHCRRSWPPCNRSFPRAAALGASAIHR